MSVSRQVRRQHERLLQKKGSAPSPLAGLESLSKLASDLKELASGGETMQQLAVQLPVFQTNLEAVVCLSTAIIEEARQIRFELERQRWVSLRLTACVHPLDPSDFTGIFALEEQFRAEFDAMRLLQETLALLDNREP